MDMVVPGGRDIFNEFSKIFRCTFIIFILSICPVQIKSICSPSNNIVQNLLLRLINKFLSNLQILLSIPLYDSHGSRITKRRARIKYHETGSKSNNWKFPPVFRYTFSFKRYQFSKVLRDSPFRLNHRIKLGRSTFYKIIYKIGTRFIDTLRAFNNVYLSKRVKKKEISNFPGLFHSYFFYFLDHRLQKLRQIETRIDVL